MSQSDVDLSIRETILQVLKSKAQNGENVIHSSDFRNAITELGYPMGSTLIENILVYCKLDKSGNINFSQLENRLSHERKVFNSYHLQQSSTNINISDRNASSAQGTQDLEYQYKVESDKQLVRVTENSAFITSIYNQLSNHSITREEADQLLQSIGILPTKEFRKLSQKIEYNQVPYSEFIFSLTKFSHQPSLTNDAAAGGYKAKPEPTGESIGSFRKRSSEKHPSLNCTANKIILQHKSGHDVFQDELIPQAKPMRKMLVSSDGTNQNIFHASQVKEVLFGNNYSSKSEDGHSQLFSSAQQSLIDGAHGSKIQATFTIEQKLQREQIWAALRKLDTNQISFFDFQDLIHSMGINVPENILIEIKRSYHAGHVDVRKFIKLLDSAIFKVSAVDEFIESNKKVDNLRKKFKKEIIESAAIIPNPKMPFKKITNFNVLNELYVVFGAMDQDNNGLLTYTEFRNVCDEFNHRLGISDDDLKVLFHSLDHNGDGVLSFHEFISVMRGEVSSYVVQTIQKLFHKLDRYSDGKILIDAMVADMRPDCHPLIRSGYFTVQQLLQEIFNFFSSTTKNFDGFISYKSFEEYFSNIAAAIDNDDEFLKMMKDCWSLSDFAPPPPICRLRHGTDRIDKVPMAIQNHGDFIAWQQESSVLEDQSKFLEAQKGRKKNDLFYQRNSQSDVISWANYRDSTNSNTEDIQQQEMKTAGVASISRGWKNVNSIGGNLLEWSEKDVSTVNNFSYKPPAIANTIFPSEQHEKIPIRSQRKQGYKLQQSSLKLG